MFRKNLGINVKLLDKDKNGRFITVSISDKIIVTCVYFPCQSSSVDYVVELSNICAMVEGVVKAYPDCVHLIAGDMNFECNVGSIGYNVFHSMVVDNNLKCMDNCDDKCGYTYFHDSLGHKTWIDHVFISESAADTLGDYMILDSGCNNSDHHPILWSLQYDICKVNVGSSHQTKQRLCRQRWDKADLCSIMLLLVLTCSLFMCPHICYMIMPIVRQK